jgi:enamine deaminase RidA (YjgF/YER057c/UK114 family)
VSDSFANPRRQVFTGLPSEQRFGYCRAIEVDGRVMVSGTATLGADGQVPPELVGNARGQADEILDRIARALGELNLELRHIVRTTVWSTDPDSGIAAMEAHGAALGEVQPVTSLVGTPFLVHPDLLVEIEAEAVR